MQSLDRRQENTQPPEADTMANGSSTFASLIAAGIQSVEPLPRGIHAHLVSPNGDPKLARAGRQITARAFPGDAAALRSCESNYERILSGNTVHRVDAPGSSDHGRDFESVSYFVYHQGATPVGIAGAYRYLDEPRRYWLGRIAVDPGHERNGFGRLQLDHIASCVTRLGGATLDAFTEDDPSNGRVHAFYEKNGFKKLDTVIQEFGHAQRIYRLGLATPKSE